MKPNSYEKYKRFYENGDIANGHSSGSYDSDESRMWIAVECNRAEDFRTIYARSPLALTTLHSDWLQTPVMAASIYGSDLVMAEIIKIRESGVAINLNEVDSSSKTPLIYAARYGYHNIATMLVENLSSAEINHEHDPNAMTALMFAAKFGHAEIVTLLLSHCTDIHRSSIDYTDIKDHAKRTEEGDKKLRDRKASRSERMEYLERMEKEEAQIQPKTALQFATEFAEKSGNPECLELIETYLRQITEVQEKESSQKDIHSVSATNLLNPNPIRSKL